MLLNNKFTLKLWCGVIILLICSNQQALAQTDLKAKVNVIAYSFASEDEQKSFLGVTNILVVKLSKIFKGEENSDFIIVRYNGKKDNYFSSDFTKNNDFKLKLKRSKFCDGYIDSLLFVRTFDENENVKKERSNLTVVTNMDIKQIPGDLKMPCYFIVQKKS